jgi:two-component system chemotaxis response regulator CheB
VNVRSTTDTIRALVVDDSAYLRRLISGTLSAIPGVHVVGTAFNGTDAIPMTLRLKPDLITLDLEMPQMNGYTFLRWLMQEQPTSTIIVSSEGGEENVLKALELGAVDFIVKPTRQITPELNVIRNVLVEKIRTLRNLRIDNVKRRLAWQPPEIPAPACPVSPTRKGSIDLVAIGASTGGPPALQTIISQLPEDFPAAVTVVQHMPPKFTRYFAQRLNDSCHLAVKEADEGDILLPGRVLIAPGGANMVLQQTSAGIVVVLMPPSPADRFTPSVNAMMQSAAELFGKRVLGVLLTGMGDDGCIGMGAIKAANGRAIAESEETAIVFGMPGEAVKAGAVDQVVPLDKIARRIWSICVPKDH